MLDAPVSGGEKGAIDGALSIMVGGDKAVFDAVLPIFQAMGKTITHLGPARRRRLHQARQPDHRRGEPHRARRGAHARARRRGSIASSPLHGARRRARRLEVPRAEDAELRRRHLQARASRSTCTSRTSGSSWSPSRALGVPLPATAVVQELFSALRVKGRGGLDHSGVITLLEDLAGLPRG